MLSLADSSDPRTTRNKNNILAFYDVMLNQHKPVEAVNEYLVSTYIQHNPLIPDGAQALGEFFGRAVKDRPKLHVKVHKIIAIGDYVWAHVNFVNLYSDDPNDRGIAGVDVFRMDSDGRAVEHWDVLQQVPDPSSGANTNGMF